MRDNLDDDELRGTSKTASLTKAIGHVASGGHHAKTKTPGQRNMSQWDIVRDDDDGDDSGGNVVYNFQEYPKAVTHPDGHVVRCENAEEEAIVLAGDKVVRDAEEKARLMAIVQLYELQVDGRWSIAKITAAIEAAGYDPALNPNA